MNTEETKPIDMPDFGIMMPLDVYRNPDGTPKVPNNEFFRIGDIKNRIEYIKNNKIYTPEYFVGVDTYDKQENAYCLMRRIGENVEILISKVIHDEAAFKEEVDNLSKYFDAIIIKES